jgi:two-component system heavy metal sensor histidine kinase CusS
VKASSHSGSILRKLEGGFALGAVVLAGLMALFMDRALHRSLEAEDAQVMEGQARVLLQQLAEGRPLPDPGGAPRPEKASWRVLDASGRLLSQSRDLEGLDLPAADPAAGPREIEAPGGGVYSVLARAWVQGEARGVLLLVLNRSHEEALIKDFRRTLLLGVIVAMAVAALLARAIARWGLAPLGALILEAGSISDQNLDRRLAAANFPLELQELVATLNAALSRLQEAFERVGNLGAELAHELRTPLQNLRSTLENRVLRAGGGVPVEPAELGALIEDCDRMAALIEQILFLARSEHGAGGLALGVIPAADLLEEVRGFFEAAAEEGGLRLEVAVEAGLAVHGDRLLLTRALHNLTANALRHTPRGGRILLAAAAEPGGVVLSVTDDGCGIAEAWLPRLGTPFLRPPEARPSEGHGLGLAIVKRIAAMLGGTMVVESQVGQGTQVEIHLPGI